MEKGKYGYINQYKKKKILITSSILVVALIIYFVGYVKFSSSICAVITAVSMLPMSKALIAVIIAIPYKTMSNEDYNDIEKHKGNGVILYDLILTSPEKVMNIDCMYITDKKIFLYITKKKQDKEYISEFVDSYCEGRLYNREVIATDDKDKFVEKIGGDVNKRKEENEEISNEILILEV